MRALLAGVTVLALAPVAAVAGPFPGPPPGVGIRLVDAPTARRADPRAQVAVVDHLAPGARIQRRVEVANGTAEPMRLLLYPVAARVQAGRFQVVEGRSSNELARWTSVAPAALELAPRSRAFATVTVAVPRGTAPGERYAAVVAELPAHAPASGGVAIASRVGVRLYLSVGGDAEPRTDFQVTSMRADRTPAGAPRVTAQVVNTGQRAIDLTGDVTLTDGPGGLAAPAYAVEGGTTLAVGARAEVGVTLDPALPPGPWHATVRLRSGPVERTVTGELMFPDAAGAAAAPVVARPVGRPEPPRDAALVAGGLLATAIAIALLLVALNDRRRRVAGQPVG